MCVWRGVSLSKLHISLMFEYFIGHVLLSKLEGKLNYDTKYSPLCWPGCWGEAQNSPEILRLYDEPQILALVGSCPLMPLEMRSGFAEPLRRLGDSFLFGLGLPPPPDEEVLLSPLGCCWGNLPSRSHWTDFSGWGRMRLQADMGLDPPAKGKSRLWPAVV